MTDDFDVVTELRARWCCILEEQLECPVCFEIRVSTEIHQCLNSHTICHLCRQQLTVCPVCNAEFSKLRNRPLENLLKQFEEIKSSLMDPEGDNNRRIILNKKSIGCQTDLEPPIVTISVETQTLEEAKPLYESIETQTEDFKMSVDKQTKKVDVPDIKVEETTNPTIVVDSSSDSDSDQSEYTCKLPPATSTEEMKPALRRSTRIRSKPVQKR